jgi:hypothetical protein
VQRVWCCRWSDPGRDFAGFGVDGEVAAFESRYVLIGGLCVLVRVTLSSRVAPDVRSVRTWLVALLRMLLQDHPQTRVLYLSSERQLGQSECDGTPQRRQEMHSLAVPFPSKPRKWHGTAKKLQPL